MGTKLLQEGNQYLNIKFNITGGEVDQLFDALKEQAQKMGWNSNPTSGILTILEVNVM